jgi:hypothetical protein
MLQLPPSFLMLLQGGELSSARREHEFTAGEEQTLRICVDAMHTAGLALGVQGLATMILGA